MVYDLAVIGGGAGGFFGAIQCAEQRPTSKVIILEKSNKLLAKVKISGGGRCNVTHACFTPKEMIENYPRGAKELLGPFHQFLCGDMMEWLDNNHVSTKIESDGRVFPESDSSQSIIDCFLNRCKDLNIEIRCQSGVKDFQKEQDIFTLMLDGESIRAKHILLASGSTPSVWELLAKKGLNIISPVPSLFTFNIQSRLLDQLMGISLPQVEVKILSNTKQHFSAHGPLLITHWGLSGPAVLKLSAWAARELHHLNYRFEIEINWICKEQANCLDELNQVKTANGGKRLKNLNPFNLPRRLWERMLSLWNVADKNIADLNKSALENMALDLCACKLVVNGKSTFKEEFVTCGGADLKEVNFKTMESKVIPGLFFAGEVLNIDAITGGFNFQAAWTEAFIAGRQIANNGS